MRNTNSRPLPAWIEKAYEILVHTEEFREGMSRQDAHELLSNHEDFENEPSDAEYAVERLLERGWLYEVGGELFVTDPDR